MTDAGALSSIGAERESLVTLDAFASDPDALRAAAAGTTFVPAAHHYPGIRAPLPDGYMRDLWPRIVVAVGAGFGHDGPLRLIDASFSIVTTSPCDLSVQQRLPHCDAFGKERIAFIHYLSSDPAGTAFFRHRSTGFETVDATRAPVYFGQLDAELRHGGAPAGYVDGDTPLFERTLLAEARYNRALLYRSYVLHSGAIPADAVLSADPLAGRLTVTAFLSLG